MTFARGLKTRAQREPWYALGMSFRSISRYGIQVSKRKVWQRRRYVARYPARDLSYITDQGGRIRRHQYLRELRTFFGPVAIAIAGQASIYIWIVARAGRTDWQNILIAVATLACVPACAAAVLSAFRRHGAPVVAYSDEAGHLFRHEAGHPFRFHSGHRSDLKPASWCASGS